MDEFRVPGLLQPGVGLHRRVARARRGLARAAGHRDTARVRSPGPYGDAARTHANRPRLARRCAEAVAAGIVALILLQVALPVFASEAVIAARLWPSPDYTRLTLETRKKIRFSLFSVSAPERLVLDLEEVEFGPTLEALQNHVRPDDPYIARLRAGRNRPGVVRVVIELKHEVHAQAFALKPIAQYEIGRAHV